MHMQVSYGGEDAHFISTAGGGALGVADGVGGWQESGVNPAGVHVVKALLGDQPLATPRRCRTCK